MFYKFWSLNHNRTNSFYDSSDKLISKGNKMERDANKMGDYSR